MDKFKEPICLDFGLWKTEYEKPTSISFHKPFRERSYTVPFSDHTVEREWTRLVLREREWLLKLVWTQRTGDGNNVRNNELSDLPKQHYVGVS
jgi:hypothetical protein